MKKRDRWNERESERGKENDWFIVCYKSVKLAKAFTSGLPNLVFVCPSNSGSGTFTFTTAVSPSLRNSPGIFATPSFNFPNYEERRKERRKGKKGKKRKEKDRK